MTIKIGMNLYLWLDRLEPKHFGILSSIRNAGYNGVEIPTGNYSPQEVAAIRTALADNQLECTVATLLSGEENPIDASPSIRQAASEKLKHDLEITAALGAEVLIGPIHSGHKTFDRRNDPQLELDRCSEFLITMGNLAKQSNISLAVEPLNRFECYFLNTAAQAVTLMENVGLSNVGILFDTHHANIEERSQAEAIKTLGSNLNHFHVSESHRGTPGTGTVDWQGALSAVQAINYAGWLTIESFGPDVPGIPDAVNIWRSCYESKTEVLTKGIELIKKHLISGA